jgi:hypothetical protein
VTPSELRELTTSERREVLTSELLTSDDLGGGFAVTLQRWFCQSNVRVLVPHWGHCVKRDPVRGGSFGRLCRFEAATMTSEGASGFAARFR